MMRLVSALLLVGATSAWAMEDFYAPQRVSLVKVYLWTTQVKAPAKVSVEVGGVTTTVDVGGVLSALNEHIANQEEFRSIAHMRATLFDRYCYDDVEVDANYLFSLRQNSGYNSLGVGKHKMKIAKLNVYFKLVGDDKERLDQFTCDGP